MIWKTILVPHDFSSSANHAAAVARDEAKLHGAKIVLLHVIELPHQLEPNTVSIPDAPGAPVNVKDYALTSADAHLKDIAQRLARDNVQATPLVRFGNPVEEISKVIDSEHIDLVVMGTHGRTGIAHLLVGSVAERVVRTSKVPVLVVRQPEHT
jgi:nucleotide-binding universal stress UspA family protein